jgi:nucleoside-diphosphate-sugar epimerase
MVKQQSAWELIVLNPSFVMGPPLTSNSQSVSLTFMTNMLSGKFKPGAAELYMAYVDVRDVAKAHIYCLENKAEGRHILSERVTDFLSFANIIREHFGNTYKLPKSNLPKWLVSLIGGLFGLSRKYVKNNVGIPIQLDASKSKEKLNLNYIPLEQTAKDMVEQMESFQKGINR